MTITAISVFERLRGYHAAIRAGKPINDGVRMTNSTAMAIMARMSAYTGQDVTWEQVWESKEDLSPPSWEFGPALPPVGLERDLLQEHYEGRYGQGFRYASLVPGMTRVVQAAGRLIRRLEDRGVVVLLDRRFR